MLSRQGWIMDRVLVSGGDAISVLTMLLRGEDDRWPLFLLGAGASFRSRISRQPNNAPG